MVKDDLIVKVDELTGEQEILREEVSNLSAAREKLRERVTQLEEELRHLKVLTFVTLKIRLTLHHLNDKCCLVSSLKLNHLISLLAA